MSTPHHHTAHPPPQRSSEEASPATHTTTNPVPVKNDNIQLSSSIPTSSPSNANNNAPTNHSPLSLNARDTNPASPSFGLSSLSQPSSPPAIDGTHTPFTRDTHTHGLDLPWITRDINHSSSSANLHHHHHHHAPSSPGTHLAHRVSELNLSAHPSRQVHSRKNQSKTACFVHSLLQNGRARSPSRAGSSDDLSRGGGGMLEVIKGPERRDRWNRGMTKKELSDMALGVRELSKRLGFYPSQFGSPVSQERC